MKAHWIVLALCLASSSAEAMYVENYAAWRGMGTAQKEGVAIGAFDGAFGIVKPNDSDAMSLWAGIRDCTISLKLDSSMLRQLVESRYQQQTVDWDKPAAWIVYDEVKRLCRTAINKYRAEAGLPPQP